MLVAGGDQRQPIALRAVGLERLTTQASAQVLGQGLAHAHREHTGFFQRSVGEIGDVARGKYRGVREGLQLFVDPDEPPLIERQARAL